MTSISAQLYEIRERFGIVLWVKCTKGKFVITERTISEHFYGTSDIKACDTIDEVKQYLSDLIICEGVFTE